MYGPKISSKVAWHRFRLWLDDWWKLVVLFGVVLLICGIAIVAYTPKHLSFKIVGHCVSAYHGGVLYGQGSGFRPYESYKIYVDFNGQPYDTLGTRNINTDGQADAAGHPSYFIWPCDTSYSDGNEISPPGNYKVTLVMEDTGKQVSATFKVYPDPRYQQQ